MITKNKFKQLPLKTKYNHIAKILEKIRESLLNKEQNQDYLLKLHTIFTFLEEQDEKWLKIDLDTILNQNLNLRELLEKVHILFNKLKTLIGYPVSENNFIQIKNDYRYIKTAKTELIIILENIQSAFNVGSFFRLTDCFGVKEIILTGFTPDKNNSSVLKTAKGITDIIKITKLTTFHELKEKILDLKSQNYEILACETALKSDNLYRFQFKPKSVLIFGNEEIGITQNILNSCDKVLEIPLKGHKNSLNVATAGAAIISEYNRQQEI